MATPAAATGAAATGGGAGGTGVVARGGGGGAIGAAVAGGGSSRGVVVSWRDWPGGGAAFAMQVPSRSSCHGRQRFSWSDCAKAEGGASSTPQIEIAIKVKRRATTKSFGRPKNEARCQYSPGMADR